MVYGAVEKNREQRYIFYAWHSMKAKKFDSEFDDANDLTETLDTSKARRPLQNQRRVNVDFPAWMIESLDREAGRLEVTRQSIIKVWLAERLEQTASDK